MRVTSSPSTANDLGSLSETLVKRETIEKEEFGALLEGKSEQEVFGSEEPHTPELPPAPPAPAERTSGREVPRPLPRPGLAGGTADIRAADPERPELA